MCIRDSVYTISRDDGTRLLPEDITGEMLLVHGNGTDLSILGGRDVYKRQYR